jgi:hypothetical protein
MNIMLTPPQELAKPRFHKATVAVRIATIDQALAIIEEQPAQPSGSST